MRLFSELDYWPQKGVKLGNTKTSNARVTKGWRSIFTTKKECTSKKSEKNPLKKKENKTLFFLFVNQDNTFIIFFMI